MLNIFFMKRLPKYSTWCGYEPISTRPSKPGPFLAGLYLNSQSIMLMKNAFIMTNQGHIAYRATVPIWAAATEKMAFASNNNQCSNRCFFLTTTYTASRSCLFHSGSKFPCGSAVVQQNHYKMSTSSLLLSKFTRLGCWYLFWNNNGFQLTLIRHNPSSHDEINTM